MPISHPDGDYWSVRKSLTKRQEELFAQWVEYVSVLSKHWSSELSVSEFQALLFIATRTLFFRKKAEGIARSHFMNGVRSDVGDQVCHGCGLGETTLRKALKSLEDAGHIVVHTFYEGKAETHQRIYEIMPEVFLQKFDSLEVFSMLGRGKNKPKTADVDDSEGYFSDENDPPQNLRHPPQNLRHPPQNLRTPPQKVRVIKDILRMSKTSTNVDVSAASQPTNSGPVLRVARKRRNAIDCNEDQPERRQNARATLEAINAKQKAKTEQLLQGAHKVPTKRWSTKQLQAILDKARVDCGITVARVIVTSKPLPTLHKRMLAAEIGDALDFFTWAFRNWSTVANANRKAKARKMRETRTTDSEMALSPNFTDLAYRFPYIAAFYNDRQFVEAQERDEAERRERERVSAKERQEKALQAHRDETRLRDIERQRQREKDEQRPRPRRSRELADDEIPQFKEKVWRG